MTLSTSSRFDIMNKVFRAIGERPVSLTEVTTTTTKCEECIKDSLHDIQGTADWTFLRVFTTADSWDNSEATLSQSNKLYSVQAIYPNSDGGRYVVPQIPTEQFFFHPVRPYFANNAFYPLWFAVKDDQTLLFNPYPVTPEEQGRIIFHYQTNLIFPATRADVFNMPERFTPLLVYRTAYHMCLRHLADESMANTWVQLYANQLTVELGRDSVVLPQNNNMFRHQGYRSRSWF